MPRLTPTRLAAPAAALLVPLALWAGSPLVAGGAPSEGTLRERIDAARGQEQRLRSAAERLGALEQRLADDVAVLERRLAAVRADLAEGEARLGRTRAELAAERERLGRLRTRLARSRALLGRRLREIYVAGRPDLVTIVLASTSLSELMERAELLRRIQRNDAAMVERVRAARDEARRAAARLADAEQRQEEAVIAVRRRRDALEGMAAALHERRAALAAARQARLAALRDTRAGRARAERELERLIAERERAAADTAGPASSGGPWAIPWPIVQCESGGQNLPPNAAGASGYYQFIPSTWRALGGSTPHAYQASKAEQDRLAAKLWNGGAGADNWDCAALVAGD